MKSEFKIPARALVFGVICGIALTVNGCTTFAQDIDAEKPLVLELRGTPKQSYAMVGKTLPNSEIIVGDIKFNANENGDFIIGFDRDEKSPVNIFIKKGNKTLFKSIDLTNRKYDVTYVNGLPPATINPPESAKTKIEADRIVKNAAWASNEIYASGFLETWRWPLNNVRITSNWGAVRSLNGTIGRPHYGIDLGAPKGTPIFAPASGKIIIAEKDLYYEGGLVGIDHGQGFISYTMHMSKVDVKAGEWVKMGGKIGEVGSTGRSTGPHLHWSLRWHGKQIDPSTMVKPMRQYQ